MCSAIQDHGLAMTFTFALKARCCKVEAAMRLIAFCGEIADPRPDLALMQREHMQAASFVRARALNSVFRFPGFKKTEKAIFGLDGGLKMVLAGVQTANDVRSAPVADEPLHRSKTTLCANSGHGDYL